MAVNLAEKTPIKISDKAPFPSAEEYAFVKIKRGTISEGIKWVKKTRSWAPDSDTLRVRRGVLVGVGIFFDPSQVDKTFEKENINSREARRLAGVRDWHRPWIKKVPHWTPDK